MYQLFFTKGSPTSDKFYTTLEALLSTDIYDMECAFINVLDQKTSDLKNCPSITPKLTKIFPLPEENFEGELKDIQKWLDKTAEKKSLI